MKKQWHQFNIKESEKWRNFKGSVQDESGTKEKSFPNKGQCLPRIRTEHRENGSGPRHKLSSANQLRPQEPLVAPDQSSNKHRQEKVRDPFWNVMFFCVNL